MTDLAGDVGGLVLQRGARLYGFGDVAGLGRGELAQYPVAVSFAFAMDPLIMAGLKNGPTPEYGELYTETNRRIDELSAGVAAILREAGHLAWPVDSSLRSDPANIRGDFPHKTAATRAGLGWIGRHCQLVSPILGPWLRLGTVLTTAPLPPATPTEKSRCGKCRACVAACPAGALSGGPLWRPGMDRGQILDAAGCDHYKKTHFMSRNQGHNCGICTAACPVGKKLLRG